MTKKITNDEYQSLALRYNEQRTINDSLQREITELKEKLESVVVDIQKQHLEYLHETHHPDDRRPPDEITDPIFVEYWKYRNEREDLKKYQSIFDCPEQEPNYWAIKETADEYNERNRIS